MGEKWNDYECHNNNFVKSNVVFNSKSVSVLPPNAKWWELEGFVSRKYGLFIFNFKDICGKTVATVELYISYMCRGSYQGRGKYLSGVTMSPKLVYADKGYYLNCNVEVGEPLNYGTIVEPVAGIPLKLKMQLTSYEEKLMIESAYGDFDVYKKSIESRVVEMDNEELEIKPMKKDSIINEILVNIDKLSGQDYINGEFYREKCVSTVEKYLNVVVRGDCTVELICASGY